MKDKIIYLVLIVIVILGAYWAYTKFIADDATPVGGVTVTGFEGFDPDLADETTRNSYKFIQILQNTDEVTLDDLAILSSDIFRNKLRDFGRPVSDRPLGRANPFAPATGVSSSRQPGAITTTTTATTSPDLPLGDEAGEPVE